MVSEGGSVPFMLLRLIRRDPSSVKWNNSRLQENNCIIRNVINGRGFPLFVFFKNCSFLSRVADYKEKSPSGDTLFPSRVGSRCLVVITVTLDDDWRIRCDLEFGTPLESYATFLLFGM